MLLLRALCVALLVQVGSSCWTAVLYLLRPLRPSPAIWDILSALRLRAPACCTDRCTARRSSRLGQRTLWPAVTPSRLIL